jgi:hypothetical protein
MYQPQCYSLLDGNNQLVFPTLLPRNTPGYEVVGGDEFSTTGRKVDLSVADLATYSVYVCIE